MIILKMFIGFICFVFLCFKLPAFIVWFAHFVVFVRWKMKDFKRTMKLKKQGIVIFKPFGLKMFCGRQGAGKTIGMVWYLDKLHQKYPKAHIYTNFSYNHQTAPLESLNDLLLYRNGDDGVIFAIDEI